MTHEDYMRQALELARACIPDGDVPVGCVIADGQGNIIGRGRNRRELDRSAVAHAEIEAIQMACAARGSWSHAPCAPEPSSMPASPRCATVPGRLNPAAVGRCSTYLRSALITILGSTADC